MFFQTNPNYEFGRPMSEADFTAESQLINVGEGAGKPAPGYQSYVDIAPAPPIFIQDTPLISEVAPQLAPTVYVLPEIKQPDPPVNVLNDLTPIKTGAVPVVVPDAKVKDDAPAPDEANLIFGYAPSTVLLVGGGIAAALYFMSQGSSSSKEGK